MLGSIDVEYLRYKCEKHSKRIADDTLFKLKGMTTISIERSIFRLLGFNGGDEGKPVVNTLMQNLPVGHGAMSAILKTMTQLNCTTNKSIEALIQGFVPDWETDVPSYLIGNLRNKIDNILEKSCTDKLDRISQSKPTPTPHTYLIVATGNIVEDAKQAYAAAIAGADIIAVIRSTAQSLLDYVPLGLTLEGFGGTFATYENFEHVRQALDVAEKETGQRKQLVNYASGLCMPEITACAALTGLDMLLNDSMYGILFRDINMQRTLIDQHFSRQLCAKAYITINTGEDNYLTTADAIEKAYTVVASQFINREFAHRAGMWDGIIGLGHAYEINPDIENSMLYEIAHATLIRNLFSECPIKYMPPTKHKTGDILRAHAHDTMYNLVSVLTNQSIHLVGMLTEAIHTPTVLDRAASLENARMVFNAARDLTNNIKLDTGFIRNRAAQVLEQTETMLHNIPDLFTSIENGDFGDIKRSRTGGRGFDGIAYKSKHYIELFA